METDYTHLFQTLMDDNYTDSFSIDLTNYYPMFKTAIKRKFLPINHMDLVVGSFIVYMDEPTMILYKVISMKDDNTWFTIADNSEHNVVHYMDEDKLYCNCPALNRDFFFKISKNDILRILNRIKERIDENRNIEDSVLTRTVDFRIPMTSGIPKRESAAPNAETDISIYENNISRIESGIPKSRKVHWLVRFFSCFTIK